MAKIKEEIPSIIPEADRIEDIEKEVRFHVARIGKPYTIVTKKQVRTTPPKFKDSVEEKNWQMNEIRKCIEGDGMMSGKMYFWYNYCWLRDPERGKIRPDFRVIDLEWFKILEECQASKEWGIVSIKRRRIGASFRAASGVLHDCVFKPFFQAGMNSKSENDSRNLFKIVKFMYQNLPEWMKPRATASDRRDYMEFSYNDRDSSGNKVKKGNQSWILSVAPVPTAHEGNAYGLLICDESGKVPIMDIWQYAEDCLKIGARRVGCPLIFGTVGDISKEGKGLMEMWKNAEVYKMKRFGQWGYNGLICDEMGNDDIENSVRYILYERHRLRTATQKIRTSFVQKYPLTEADAFNHVNGGGVGDVELINEQILHLMTTPPKSTKGFMRRNANGSVDFVPDNDKGHIIVYEHPKPRVNGYIAMTDPCEDDDIEKTRDTSEIATVICAKPFGEEPSRLVVEFAYRPMKLDMYFEQVGMLLIWFNKTKIQIEMNKGGWRMRKYFETHYPDLLALSPVSATSAKGGVEWRIGVKKTAERTVQMEGLGEEYVENHYRYIPSIKLLEQLKVVGGDHVDDDLAVAWLWALVLMQSDRTVAKSKEELSKNIPNLSYQKNGRGFQLISNGTPVKGSSNRGRSALFKW